MEHNFKRFLTQNSSNIQPFWYYGGILLIAFLPGLRCCSGARRRRNSHSPHSSERLTIFLLCWSVFCVAFFTVSRSKLPGYILPAVPPNRIAAGAVRNVARFNKALVCLRSPHWPFPHLRNRLCRNLQKSRKYSAQGHDVQAACTPFLFLLVFPNLFFAILVVSPPR
jgi:hypothetical protein